jgi:hypothetical protein
MRKPFWKGLLRWQWAKQGWYWGIDTRRDQGFRYFDSGKFSLGVKIPMARLE